MKYLRQKESLLRMGSSGNKRCGILSGIFGSLVTLGIGIVIGLYRGGPIMPAILVVKGTKYACNLDSKGD